MNDLLSNPQVWGLLLGLLSPLLISVVQQPKFSAPVRSIVAVVCAVVIGVVTCLSLGQFNPADLLTTCTAVLVASHTAYESFFKPTGTAPAVEAATSKRDHYARAA